MKVGVHFYLPNAKINLQSNFNSEKLVKSETLLYVFVEVGIKGGEIFWNILKFRMHTCLSNGHSNLSSNFNYKKLLKSETSSFFFARVGLKGSQNSLEHCKIPRNPLKVCIHGYLSNGYLNSLSNFNDKKPKK